MLITTLVLKNKPAHKLGILPGDLLIALNGKSVRGSSHNALEMFRTLPLPFSASFRRFVDGNTLGTVTRRSREVVCRARDDLVCGFIRKHTTLQCSNDVLSVINRYYFAERQTPLLTASLHGYYGVVRALLETPETNVLARQNGPKGRTALHMAAFSGFDCELLLEHGIDVNISCMGGITALSYAVHEGDVAVVKTLLRHHADVNLSTEHKNESPLMRACRRNHPEMVQLLLETDGIKINQIGGTVDYARCGTSLSVACSLGAIECVKHLLAHPEVDVNLSGRSGRSPLIFATEEGHYEIAKLLLLHGADVNQPNAHGITPLHLAAGLGHLAMVRLLLQCPDIEIDPSPSLATPLMCASSKGFVRIVDLLLKRGADVSVADERGFNSLDCAIHSGYADVVDILLRNKAHPRLVHVASSGVIKHSSTDKCQVHIAAQYGYHDILKKLYDDLMRFVARLQHNDSVNAQRLHVAGCWLFVAQNKDGYSPLHLACKGGHEEAAKFLVLTAGADVFKEDAEGKTAQQHATESGNESLIAWLRMYISQNAM